MNKIMDKITTKKIEFVVTYGRVSTSNQEDQKTIEAQILEVRKYAKDNNYTIVKEYSDEGWSGDILARPDLDQLRMDARRRAWQAVIIYDPDRLGRRLFYQQIVIDELKQLDIEILFVTMPRIENESDELMFGIRGLFAQYEKAKITERFRMGKRNRVNNNNVLTTEAPYGYTYILNKGKRGATDYVVGHYEINPRESKVVENIFSWVADEHMTLRHVVRRLQELEIRPQRSKRGVWNTSTLSTLLRNETYIGIAHWGASYAVVPTKPLKEERYRKNKKTSRRMRPKNKWYNIKVPAIVGEDVFKRAGAQLTANFATLGRNDKKNRYLLAGKIWCPCGERRAGEGVLNGQHLYYRCTDRVHSFPLPHTCHEGGINARIADEAIWQRLKNVMSSPAQLNELVERRLTRDKGKVSTSTIDIEATRKEIMKLKGQEDRYNHAFAEEVISIEKLKEYLAPVREKVSNLENQIIQANLEMKPENEIPFPNKGEIESFVSDTVRFLENLNFESKRAIVRRIVEKATATQKELQVYGGILLKEIYVLFPEDRNCGVAECGEVHFVQRAYQTERAGRKLSVLHHQPVGRDWAGA